MFGSTLALRVKSDKGSRQRLIPCGARDRRLILTQQHKEGLHVRHSERSLEYTLRSCPILNDGELRTVTPHELRGIYARQLYFTGKDLTAIQQNMGHEAQDINPYILIWIHSLPMYRKGSVYYASR